MSRKKRNAGAVFVILRETLTKEDTYYEVVDKGFSTTNEGKAIVTRKVKSGELEPGTYFVGQFKSCIKYAVEVVEKELAPSDLLDCDSSDESPDPTETSGEPTVGIASDNPEGKTAELVDKRPPGTAIGDEMIPDPTIGEAKTESSQSSSEDSGAPKAAVGVIPSETPMMKRPSDW